MCIKYILVKAFFGGNKMIDTNQYVREVFSMLSNLCIPTINHVIKEELHHFLNEIEKVVDEKDLGYLIQVLMKFDIDELEQKHDQLNINFVEMTFALYEVWMKYIESEIKDDFVFSYHIDKQFIESTSEKFFVCILDQKFIAIYKKLHQFDILKEELIKTNIVSKYQDNKIKGSKKNNGDIHERIQHVFKVIKYNLTNFDVDLDLFKFIEDYEEYCFVVIDRIDELDNIMIGCKDRYINMCIEVFGGQIESIYQNLEERNLQINTINLKLHVLEFLKMMML